MRMLTGAIYQCAQRAHALVVFLPHPEIIYINTPYSLPRPEVIYIYIYVHWLISAKIGVSEYHPSILH